MEAVIYTLIFIIGTLFGSFFTLAIYRIPLGENIVYKHSFCPNCNAKLKFKDLIPIVSYIALGGKCAYCGQKIRIRYLLLEVLSGFVFLLFALSFKINFYTINTGIIIYFTLFILYIASLFIIAGIDKENIQIEKSLLVFGIFLSTCYMTYVCIHEIQAIYTYIIYLVLIAIFLIADTLFMKKKKHQSYLIECLMLILYMLIFTGSKLTYITIILSFFWIGIYALIIKIMNRKTDLNKKDRIPLGFCLCVSNLIIIILSNIILR